MRSDTRPPRSELAQALGRCNSALWGVGLVSGLVNILMLTGPLFMLQVYDRVLPSRSVPTLVGLVILIIALFAFQGVLDALRARVLQRTGLALDEALSARVYGAIVRLPLKAKSGDDNLRPLRDLDQIRGFFASGGPAALFDLPWMPLYIGLCYLFHPLIGLAALGGALILIALTFAAEVATHEPAKAASSLASTRAALAEASRRNAGVLTAMGMGAALAARWQAINRDYLRHQQRTSDRASSLGSLSRATRLSVAIGCPRPWRLFGNSSGGLRRSDHRQRHPRIARARASGTVHR